MKTALCLFLLGVFIVCVSLVASVVNRRLPPSSCVQMIEAMHGERIAREGKTDREFYAANPNHFK